MESITITPLVFSALAVACTLLGIAIGAVGALLLLLKGLNVGQRTAKGLVPAPEIDGKTIAQSVRVVKGGNSSKTTEKKADTATDAVRL